MTSPDSDEPHAIADTQMFRRFVDEPPAVEIDAKPFWMWTWPGILVPVVVAVVIVAGLIVLFSR